MHCAQEMAALCLTEEAAERLVSPTAAHRRGSSVDAASAASAASSDNVHRDAADSLEADHGTSADHWEPAGGDSYEDGDGNGGTAEPSVLDGLDALDPDYWDAAPAPAANGTRPQAGKPRPQRDAPSDLEPVQPSPDQPSGPDTSGREQRPAQPSSGVGSEDSDDGGGMGLFDEDGGTEWDTPPPAAKPQARAASHRPAGKAKGLSVLATRALWYQMRCHDASWFLRNPGRPHVLSLHTDWKDKIRHYLLECRTAATAGSGAAAAAEGRAAAALPHRGRPSAALHEAGPGMPLRPLTRARSAYCTVTALSLLDVDLGRVWPLVYHRHEVAHVQWFFRNMHLVTDQL